MEDARAAADAVIADTYGIELVDSPAEDDARAELDHRGRGERIRVATRRSAEADLL